MVQQQQGGQVISSSTSTSSNPSYSLPEQIPNTQPNSIETPVTVSHTKDGNSPLKSTSLHAVDVVIKQENETFYGAEIGSSFNENENFQVYCYTTILDLER